MGNLGYRKNQWNSQVRPGKTNRSYRGSNGIQGSDIGDVLDDMQKKWNRDVQQVTDSIGNVAQAYGDVVDGGINPQDYKPWMSFLPFFDKIQKYQDKKRQWDDYYKHTGRYPAYTSNIPTFGSTSALASGILGEARDIAEGLYSVGKLSKRL